AASFEASGSQPPRRRDAAAPPGFLPGPAVPKRDRRFTRLLFTMRKASTGTQDRRSV
ncbi:MAG: hypothetical protein AVDCRST_MAG69-822, partial [uncultured Solirubrobacteraceae bacterium]